MALVAQQEGIWQAGEKPLIVKRGDMWQLGMHRLACMDATNADDVASLFDDEHFALCFTSPPYSDQRTYNLDGVFDWDALMCGVFAQIVAHGLPDCHILINLGLSHKDRQVDMYWLRWLLYCAEIGWPLFGWYVWDKVSCRPGEWYGRLAQTHEFLFHFNQITHSANKWVKTAESTDGSLQRISYLRKDGQREDVHSPSAYMQPFKVPSSVVRITRETRSIDHPAVFPVALPEFVMQTWSQPNDIVYDPFCGSGTSLLAGANLNRKVYACEISPEYCRVAIARFVHHTGIAPVLLSRKGAN